MLQRLSECAQAQHVQVLGVSPDSLETHQRFSNDKGISFPLISDGNGQIQRQYLPGRVTVVINQHRIITHIQKGIPDSDMLLGALASIAGGTGRDA